MSYPQFSGGVVWGAAYDPDNGRILFSSGATLHEWPLSGMPNSLGNFTSTTSDAVLAMVALAYYDGNLYGVRNISSTEDPEGIYEIDPVTLQATLTITYDLGAASVDLGGIDADPNTGTLYGTNDGTSERGLVEIDLDGTLILLAPYPEGETDIDGLAISDDGRAFLITDEPGDIYVYDFNTLTYTAPISNPWTTSETFSAGAWITNGPSEGPAISLDKTVGTDPSVCATADEIAIPAVADVTYCYEVTNTGTLTLSLHDLGDGELGPILNDFPFILVPGASAFLTQTAAISATTINTATWTAYNAGPTDVVSATDSATVTVGELPGAAISLTKTMGTDPSLCAETDELTVESGTEVTYCYEVINTGDITLTLHDLDDTDLGPIVSSFPHDLEPGANFFITQTLIVTSSVVNTATWTAYNSGPTDVVTATASAAITIGDELPAEIDLSPESLSETLGQNAQSSQTITISNMGTADLEWSIEEATAVCDTPGDVPWLSVSPLMGTTAGGSNDEVDVAFDATDLDEGEYTGLLCIETNDPDEVMIPVTITLTVVGNRLHMPIIMGSPLGNP